MEGCRRIKRSENAVDPRSLFEAEQIERGKRYHRPLYLALASNLVVALAILALLAFGEPGDALLELVDGSRWWLSALAYTVVVLLASALLRLPLSFWRGHVHERRFQLSTQGAAGWAIDWAKSVGIGVTLTAIVVVAFLGLVRTSPAWPVAAALLAAGAVLLLTFVAPVVLEPIFNRFEPLADEALSERIRRLAERAGVPVQGVLVADASRRTRKQNAYVSGLGATRRIVLFDTFLEESAPEEVDAVVAHELAHRLERHVAKSTAAGMAGAAAVVAVLWLLLEVDGLVAAAGAGGPEDPRVVPFILLVTGVLELAAMPFVAALSRRWERAADRIALELTSDRGALESLFRRLAVANLADLDPPRLVRALIASHPTIPERIATLRA